MELFKDHTIEGRALFPGAGFVEMALAVAGAAGNAGARRGGVELRGVSFLEPLDLEVGTALVCEVSGGGMEFRPVGEDRVVCDVAEVVTAPVRVSDGDIKDKLTVVQARCTEEVDGLTERYAELAARGFHGPRFQTLAQVWRSSDGAELVARLALPDAEECSRYLVHPAVLDGALQLVGLGKADAMQRVLGVQDAKLVRLCADMSGQADHAWRASARAVGPGAEASAPVVFDLKVFASGGAVEVLSVEGATFAELELPLPAVGVYGVQWRVDQLRLHDAPAETPAPPSSICVAALSSVGDTTGPELASALGCECIACDGKYDDVFGFETLVVTLRQGDAHGAAVREVLRLLRALSRAPRDNVRLGRAVVLTRGQLGPPNPSAGGESGGAGVWGRVRSARFELPHVRLV
jgi:hypothetical protein